ncbi:MAG: hypothetical protein AB9915_03700 [Candidatus Dojkabacteria bacterium]
MNRVDTNTDKEKRTKLLLLAAFIALAIFLSKILQSQSQVLLWKVYTNAAIYFCITFVGLLWAFNFQVRKKSLLFLLQASLFIFAESIFIELFFFQKFNRIYEFFILLLLMALVFLGNYVSFLMANVFNVDLFKKIPLVHVGRTSSYLVSLFMMYFFTFSMLVTGFPIYILLPIIVIIYSMIIYIHYLNIGIEKGEIFGKSLLTLLICMFLFLGVFLSGDIHELIAAVPVVGYYLSVSVVMKERISSEDKVMVYIFGIIIFIVSLASLLLNILT